VTGEEFMGVYGDSDLRQYIVDQAKRRSKKKEVQEDMIQEAWLWISMFPGDCSPSAFNHIVDSAIFCEYKKEWKDKRVREAYYYRMGLMMNSWR